MIFTLRSRDPPGAYSAFKIWVFLEDQRLEGHRIEEEVVMCYILISKIQLLQKLV